MTLASDLVRTDILDPLYCKHLPIVVRHNGVAYTSTAKIRELFRSKSLVDSIKAEQEQRLYNRLRMQNDFDEEDEHDSRYQ